MHQSYELVSRTGMRAAVMSPESWPIFRQPKDDTHSDEQSTNFCVHRPRHRRPRTTRTWTTTLYYSWTSSSIMSGRISANPPSIIPNRRSTILCRPIFIPFLKSPNYVIRIWSVVIVRIIVRVMMIRSTPAEQHHRWWILDRYPVWWGQKVGHRMPPPRPRWIKWRKIGPVNGVRTVSGSIVSHPGISIPNWPKRSYKMNSTKSTYSSVERVVYEMKYCVSRGGEEVRKCAAKFMSIFISITNYQSHNTFED